jgi:L-fucose isomerase-like protein
MSDPFSHQPPPAKVAVIGGMMAYFEPMIGPDAREVLAGHVSDVVARLESPDLSLSRLGLWSEEADTDGLARAVAQLSPDVLLLVPTMATPPAALARLARSAGVPVVIACGHELTHVGPDYDMRALCRHSVNVGATMLGAMIRREPGPPPVLVSGFLDDADFHDRLSRAIRSALLARRLDGLRVGRVGPVMPGYDHLGLTEAEGVASGVEIVDVPLADWAGRVASISSSAVRDFIADRLPALIPAQTRIDADDGLIRASRLALALDSLAKDLALDCGSLSCRGPFGVGLDGGAIGCLATSLMTGSNRPFSATGDLVTAIAMLIGKALGGATLYCELDAVDRPNGAFLVANTGEADFAWAPPGGEVVIRDAGELSGRDVPGVVLSHQLLPGPATMLGVTLDRSTSDRLKLIALEGRTAGLPPTALKVPQGWFVSRSGDPIKAFEGWANAGATQHGALSRGHLAEAAQWLAAQRGWAMTTLEEGLADVA